jgi:hypothetical protein
VMAKKDPGPEPKKPNPGESKYSFQVRKNNWRAAKTSYERSQAGKKGGGSQAAADAARKGGLFGRGAPVGSRMPKRKKMVDVKATCRTCGGNKEILLRGGRYITCTGCSGYGWQWAQEEREV